MPAQVRRPGLGGSVHPDRPPNTWRGRRPVRAGPGWAQSPRMPAFKEGGWRHEDLHGGLAQIGVLAEFRGHANGYCAVDIVNEDQDDAMIEMLTPLAQVGTVTWEWADLVVPD